MDGTIIRGYRYSREEGLQADTGQRALLCLASDTGNSREFHRLALALLRLKNGGRPIFAIDMRGRGLSDRVDVETYTPLTEAEDIVSFCDAMGLHEVDVFANGGGSMAALLVAPRRPGLIRSIIFNDGGPERDGVGIARTKAIYQRMPEPTTWEEAVDVLKQAKGKDFPALKEADWMDMAQSIFEETDNTLIRSHDPIFTGAESHIDFDERLPMFWKEFGMFRSRPVLVIRGENSTLMTEALTKRMRPIAPLLQEIVVEGQGHPPLLGGHGLPKKILDFLNQQRG